MNKIINNILESFDIILNENKSLLNEVLSKSSSLFGGSSVKIPADGAHAGQSGGWFNSNAWDIAAAPNTPVYAIASGKVITMNNYGTDLIETEGKRLYGYGFTVDSTDNLPDVYYTHLTTVSVKQGDNIQCGQFLGYVMKSPKPVNYDHVHIGVETGNIKKLLNPDGTLKCGGTTQSATTQSATTQSATTQPDSDNNNIETAFIRQLVTPLHGAITKGITEEKVYSKLGNEISSKFGNIIIPSRGNTKIKSPINGVVNNYHSDRHCTNKISIEHSIDNKLYYLQFCNISKPEIRDGKKVSKGDIIGSTSSDVTVSLYDKGLNRLNLPTMLNKEINKKEKSTNVISKTKNKEDDEEAALEKLNQAKHKEITYYDPLLPWLGKKIFDVGKKIQDKMPSMTKGGEPKTKNFFNKYGMSNKKVDENIERIKTLLK